MSYLRAKLEEDGLLGSADFGYSLNINSKQRSILPSDPLNTADAIKNRVAENLAAIPASASMPSGTTLAFVDGLEEICTFPEPVFERKKSLEPAILDVDSFNSRQPAVLTALQEWEGRVLFASEDGFTAALADVTAGSRQELEEADFDLSEIGEGDLPLVRPGAIFRWVIGYRKEAGTKTRYSKVVFRRLPAWSKNDIAAIKKEAIELANGINWE